MAPTARALALRQFATWHLLRHLRTTAERRPIGPYRDVNARGLLRHAATFLTDLAARGRDLTGCTQADIDRWHASASRTEQDLLRPFLAWAIRRHHTSRLRLPTVRRGGADQPGRAASPDPPRARRHPMPSS